MKYYISCIRSAPSLLKITKSSHFLQCESYFVIVIDILVTKSRLGLLCKIKYWLSCIYFHGVFFFFLNYEVRLSDPTHSGLSAFVVW